MQSTASGTHPDRILDLAGIVCFGFSRRVLSADPAAGARTWTLDGR
jgi:hypothetical protein